MGPPPPIIIMPVSANPELQSLKLVDIRGSSENSNTSAELKNEIVKGLSKKSVKFQDYRAIRAGGPAEVIKVSSLPTMLLYDSKGLDIFDKITYDKDYYLTDAEIDILQNNANGFVEKYVNDGDCIIELGAGAMRKTKFILQAISDSKKTVTYYAVDLSDSSLKNSMEPYISMFPTITFVGLWGTYHDSLKWLKNSKIGEKSRKLFLWLGSSIGNYSREEGAELMANFCENGMDDGSIFVCGIDRRNSFETVSLAYNDRSGLTREFSLNGLVNANSIFGFELFKIEKFGYVSIYNEIEGRHEAYYEVLEDQLLDFGGEFDSIILKKGQLIQFEYSYKYANNEVMDMVKRAGLSHLGKFTDKRNLYDLHVLYKSPFPLADNGAIDYDVVPHLNEWNALFKSGFIKN